jgi:DNA-directed RNA polymerase subunit L
MKKLSDIITDHVAKPAEQTEDGLMWQCENKNDIHTLVAKLNDVILNDAKLQDVKYGTDHSTIFSAGRKSITLLHDMNTMTVSVAIKGG